MWFASRPHHSVRFTGARRPISENSRIATPNHRLYYVRHKAGKNGDVVEVGGKYLVKLVNIVLLLSVGAEVAELVSRVLFGICSEQLHYQCVSVCYFWLDGGFQSD